MSILGNINPILIGDLIALAAALVISLPLAIWLGVFRASAVVGPVRLPEDRPVVPLVIAFFMGFGAMIVVASVYVIWKQRGSTASSSAPVNSMVDRAFLFSVPSLASMAVLILFDIALGGAELLRFLGLNPGRLPAGLAKGILAAVVIIPATNVVGILIEVVYQLVKFQHPTEHELLTSLRETPAHPVASWVLVLSATIIAPVSEEILFRGHLQTLIRKVLVTISSPPRVGLPGGFPIQPAGFLNLPAGFPMDSMPIALPPVAIPVLPAPRPAVWQTWAAIVLTSCLFAMMHERWMWPPIFFLSLGLGYCYERTGNLWTNVTVHCLFNTTSTLLFMISTHT